MKLSKTFVTLAAIFFILSAVRIYTQPITNENNVKFEDVQTATLVGQDGVIMRTEDGGLNWIEQTSGITNVLNSNDYISYNDNNGELVKLQIAVGENGVILKSIDNGTTWDLIESNTTENLNDVAIFSPNMIFVCGANGTLLKSNDYGETWSPVAIATANSLNEITVTGPSLTEARISAVVVGDSGTIFASINMEDWFAAASPTTENLFTVTSMGNNVVCAGTNGTILRSFNYGYDWEESVSGIITSVYDTKFVNANTVVGSSENGVMVRSEDAGITWSIIETPTTSDLFAVNFGSETFGISTGADGTEIYTTDGGINWMSSMIIPSDKTAKDNVSLTQNYPNPFNPSTIINYTVSDNSNISIKVYDLTGREVRTLVNTFQNAGTYSVNFNASNLSSGIYFYVLRVNNGTNNITKTMRMILTK